ncbi:bifunctional [glutamine synthetase] adenylyltransferase/[glutamine synthetase]-adenylyl-L-tyrosine phosphorylase [Pseudoclavibacter helvolus]|uniref:bifunctional [glutamine synthetase] adenylyltransferase/[glutamine synthetase]-adenylyl-L-tyrosine phosphorylase n=1 Tax=Pseudoclavibacter helvolus TaxID=255205 RepID=UPI000837DCC6|nr:bifunctional [glutamine synthetase] adenylyltransferase/[glutamine synthetase]-adenylyl-L-tyrosine phosphorylase [Pseudoclavibacter helvolus]
MRSDGLRTRLARAGFAAPSEAEPRLTELAELTGVRADDVFSVVDERVADPDQALQWLVYLARQHPSAVDSLFAERPNAKTVVRLLGASTGLAEFFLRHPRTMEVVQSGEAELPTRDELQRRMAASVGVDAERADADGGFGMAVAQLTGSEAARSLRIRYRTELARITAFDLAQDDQRGCVREVSRALADLAGETLDAAIMVARAETQAPPSGFGRFPAEQVECVRLAVIGMGKAGAEELNYISDVDIMFVAESSDPDCVAVPRAVEIGTRLASLTMRVIDSTDVEPALWEVDANLRPEGKDGALVRTIDSYAKYYERWAKNWEFQALIKSRAMAGDLRLGAEFERRVEPLIWASASRADFVDQVRAMRERVTDHIPAEEVDLQIKLGPGGLRDIEFTVQLLQLVHGQHDESVRERSTLAALEALSEGGYIGRDDANQFSSDYEFLRLLEHRIQLRALRRTHLMPTSDIERAVLARSASFANSRELTDEWQRVKLRVRGLHEKVFYRPLLSAVAALPTEGFALSSDQAEARLRAIGFLDPKGALAHITALVKGVSRRAIMQRTLLPVLIDWFSQGSDPDSGFLAFRKLSERLGDTAWYLRLLRDSSAAAKRLTQLLSGSKFAAEFFELYPEAVKWLDDDAQLKPRSLSALLDEVATTIRRHDDEVALRRALRTFRRREVLRLAIGGLLSLIDIKQTGSGLSDIATATLQGAYDAVRRIDKVEYPPFAIIAMGRYGGRELGFGSDLDVLYVFEPGDFSNPDLASRRALSLVHRIVEFTADPRMPIDLDAGLRPEGKSGPLVRSLSAYRSYYARWSLGWETQALLRAQDVVGDPNVRDRFMDLVDDVRYGKELSEDGLREVRRIKARVENERLPQGADPKRHLKLGRGSLSDVEWLAQTLQLQHAMHVPSLRTTSTLGTLDAAQAEELLTPADANQLRDAWLLASRVRSALYLGTNKQSDLLPQDGPTLDAVARALGYAPGSGPHLEDDYLGETRRSRRVFERLFYGE